jgi:uncharacterized protein
MHNKPLFKMVLLSAISLSFTVLTAFSLKVPAAPESWVNDYAGIISRDTKDRLDNYLENFEQEKGVQIFVAAFPSLEGDSLEDFSMRLAEKWKVGPKSSDKGVILLVIKDDNKIRIEVGYGLEGDLTDAKSSEIIRNVIAPYFKEGDYDGGITAGIEAIVKTLSGESVQGAESSEGTRGYYSLNKEKIIKIAAVIICAFILFFIIDLLRYFGYASGRKNYGHRYSFFEWLLIFSITLAILKLIFYMFLMRGRGFGGGGSGWGGGGGFSGGGGGSFGGGGASGGW